jgi:hypothetical protein
VLDPAHATLASGMAGAGQGIAAVWRVPMVHGVKACSPS